MAYSGECMAYTDECMAYTDECMAHTHQRTSYTGNERLIIPLHSLPPHQHHAEAASDRLTGRRPRPSPCRRVCRMR
jgi:hypothetical protein